MTEPQGKTPLEEYNCAVDTLKDLQSKQDATKDKTGKMFLDRQTKINNLQSVTIPLLEQNKNGVLLSVTCITYLQTWVKEQLYNRRKEFRSKYTEKGNVVEKDAIELAADYYGWGMVDKNELHFENDYATGTPDVVLRQLIADTKASWSCFTFPLFETELDKAYYWQDITYMDLAHKELAATIYCLIDAPDNLVESEARKLSFEAGFTEVEADFYDQVKASMTYSNLPPELRLKRFDVARDNNAIESLKDRVEKCRWYLKNLQLPTIKTINQLKAA